MEVPQHLDFENREVAEGPYQQLSAQISELQVNEYNNYNQNRGTDAPDSLEMTNVYNELSIQGYRDFAENLQTNGFDQSEINRYRDNPHLLEDHEIIEIDEGGGGGGSGDGGHDEHDEECRHDHGDEHDDEDEGGDGTEDGGDNQEDGADDLEDHGDEGEDVEERDEDYWRNYWRDYWREHWREYWRERFEGEGDGEGDGGSEGDEEEQDSDHDDDHDHDCEHSDDGEQDDNEPSSPYGELQEAVDWAQENVSQLDFDRDGKIDHDEIRMAQHFNYGDNEDQEALRTLDRYFGAIAIADFDSGRNLDALTMRDLSNFEGQIDSLERTYEISEMLTSDPQLFNALDGADDGGHLDGKISKGDLERFMRDGMRNFGSGVYTLENMQAVSELLRSWDHEWGAGNLLRNDERYITRNRISNYRNRIIA